MSKIINRLTDKFRFSIRAKITVPYGILSIIIALGGALFITELIMEAINRRFDNSLVETSKVSSDILVSEENLMLETIRILANTSVIKEAILAADSEKIREYVIPIGYNSFEDVIVILDHNGENLLTLENVSRTEMIDYAASKSSPFFKTLPFAANVLQQKVDDFGDKYAGTTMLNKELIFFIAAPIHNDKEEQIGVVMVGRQVDTILASIRKQTLAQVTFYDFDGNVLASTLRAQQPLSATIPQTVLTKQNESSVVRDITNVDINYREVITPWEARDRIDLGLVGVSFSTDFLTETSQTTRVQVLVFVTVLLFLTIITGIFISRLITNPINQLKMAAMAVSNGDLTTQIQTASQDEIAILATTFNEMINSLRASKEVLLDAYDKTLEGWSKALELKDKETDGHTQRVMQLSMEMATRFGIVGEELEHLKRGAMLHDIGKVGIPDHILKKPASLTYEEFEIIKKHPQFAYEMLSTIPFLKDAVSIPYYHHEKWDGSGYPNGLKGEEIPLSARIFAVVDVWDAITSDRIYRKAMSEEIALNIINQANGHHFDPKVVREFLNYMSEKKLIQEPTSGLFDHE